MIPHRFTYHLHSASGRWYVWDHLQARPRAIGFTSPTAAIAALRRLDAEWLRECRRRRRQERAL